MPAIRVGSREASFELVEGWLKVPAGWDYGDVSGIAADSEGRVYLYTRSEHGVVVHNPDGSYRSSWGSTLVDKAHGIRIVNDFVYIADMFGHTVHKCSLDGEVLLVLGQRGRPSDTGYVREQVSNLTTIHRAAGPFNSPAMAMPGPNGDIYVADGYGNARIHRFSPDGELLQSWGSPGTKPGEFMCVHSLWVHTDGRIFVCDRENNRIQIFDPSGSVLECWNDIFRPDDICISGDRVFIGQEFSKAGHPRMEGGTYETSRPSMVTVRDFSGRELTTWGDVDEFAPGYFMSAHSLCADLNGNLFVAETPLSDLGTNYKPGIAKFVQKFEPA